MATTETLERLTPEKTETTEARPPSRRRRGRTYVAAGGIAVGGLLLTLSAVMQGNADFSKDYVARQLAEQRITFKAAEALTPAERETPCLVKFAGQALTTGPQAECYANHFIGVHLKSVADGKTFSEMRGVQTDVRNRVTEAQAKGDPAAGDLQRQLNEITGKRQALFEGESMRGLLLTSYGFDTLGRKAGEAATVARGAGIGVLVLSGLALIWVATTRRSTV
ncbi:MAG: hypothetical protein ACRD12_20635 [Acidimicrobiales bacterium]